MKIKSIEPSEGAAWKPLQIRIYRNFRDSDNVCAIASVWDGFRHSSIPFAFCSSVGFQIFAAHSDEAPGEDQYCVSSPSDFLIPITLPAKTKGTVGHHVLAIAKVIDTSNEVQITFLDSSPGFRDRTEIRDIARNVIKNSRWCRSETEIVWSRESWPDITIQGCTNTCGMHVVLNAWAYMLDLPLAKLAKSPNAKFYRRALVMINLAMEGRMTGEVIHAFMQSYGFCEFQDINAFRQEIAEEAGSEQDEKKVRNDMVTSAMDEDRLEKIIKACWIEEQTSGGNGAAAAGPAKTSGSGDQNGPSASDDRGNDEENSREKEEGANGTDQADEPNGKNAEEKGDGERGNNGDDLPSYEYYQDGRSGAANDAVDRNGNSPLQDKDNADETRKVAENNGADLEGDRRSISVSPIKR